MHGSYKNLASCTGILLNNKEYEQSVFKTPFNLYLRLIQKKDLSFMWNSYIDYKLASCEL